MESQREPFVQACMRKVKSPDYCDCGWQQFKETFKSADLSKPLAQDDPLLVELQHKTVSACGSKLSEEQIKASFLASCTGDEPRKAGYCACAWPALRKTLSVSDFIGDFSGPRFDEAKKAMVVTCKGKFPEDVAKANFMIECGKGDAGRTHACECAWKKLHEKYSTEEIVSGTLDVSAVPGLKDCQ